MSPDSWAADSVLLWPSQDPSQQRMGDPERHFPDVRVRISAANRSSCRLDLHCDVGKPDESRRVLMALGLWMGPLGRRLRSPDLALQTAPIGAEMFGIERRNRYETEVYDD